jgi:hypothetical protein
VSSKISSFITKYNIKTVHAQKKKNRRLLRTVKADLGLKIPIIYSIPCECGKVYIGQTGSFIEAKCKEYVRNSWLDQPEEYVVAEHSTNTLKQIDFNNVSVLDRAPGYMECLFKEAIQI